MVALKSALTTLGVPFMDDVKVSCHGISIRLGGWIIFVVCKKIVSSSSVQLIMSWMSCFSNALSSTLHTRLESTKEPISSLDRRHGKLPELSTQRLTPVLVGGYARRHSKLERQRQND